MIHVDAYLFFSCLRLVTLTIDEQASSVCTVPPDKKEAKLGGSN